MGKFWAAIEALQQGKQLANSGGWKNAQALGSFIASLGALFVAFKPEVAGQIDSLTTGLTAALVAGVNIYLTLATSAKVGLPAAEAGDGGPGAEGQI